MVNIKRVLPYSLALLFCRMKMMEEKERVMSDAEEESELKSRYRPPPLTPPQDINAVELTESVVFHPHCM